MAQSIQQTTRLDFLFEAGYTLLSTCPQLSRYYMNEFQNTLTEYELNLPKQTERFLCKRCGQIQISGLTQKVRLVKKTKILNICLACQEQKKYHGTLKHKKTIPKNNTTQQPVAISNVQKQPVATSNVQKQPNVKQPIVSAKPNIQTQPTIAKKKNKGKKNNLQALLNKQQQQQQKPSNNSLNDFLSSL